MNRSGQGVNGRRGFTLIELMLAIFILAIIMTIVCGVVASTVEAAHRVEEVLLSSEVGPAILSQIRRDLEGAFVPAEDVEYFFVVDRKGSSGERDRIDFVASGMSYGPEREGDRGTFQSVNEIGYQVVDNREEPGVGILCRREDYFIDADPLKGGALTELYDRVRHFAVSFWNGEKWVEEWSSKEGRGLPPAVKIELTIVVNERDDVQKDRAYSTVITFMK